jgi:hypothetical protein
VISVCLIGADLRDFVVAVAVHDNGALGMLPREQPASPALLQHLREGFRVQDLGSRAAALGFEFRIWRLASWIQNLVFGIARPARVRVPGV